jgi:hypothetical protein
VRSARAVERAQHEPTLALRPSEEKGSYFDALIFARSSGIALNRSATSP